MNQIEPESSARWPGHLMAVVGELHQAPASARVSLRAKAWLIIQTAIAGYARLHASRLGRLCTEDILDIAAQKSLELLLRVDSEAWNPATESEGQIRALLSTVARNGVVDTLRANGRTIRFPDPEEIAMRQIQPNSLSAAKGPPVNRVEVAEFVECLHGCVAKLTPRARKLWFFRVIYELPSKGIADHPAIQMTVGNVDVTLQRCRKSISECMDAKGLKLKALPPGTFSALWELCTQGSGTLLEEESHG